MFTGWNHETETVHAWITGTEASLDRVSDLVGNVGRREVDHGGRVAALADVLETVVPTAGIADEVIDWHEVDWHQVASALIGS